VNFFDKFPTAFPQDGKRCKKRWENLDKRTGNLTTTGNKLSTILLKKQRFISYKGQNKKGGTSIEIPDFIRSRAAVDSNLKYPYEICRPSPYKFNASQFMVVSKTRLVVFDGDKWDSMAGLSFF